MTAHPQLRSALCNSATYLVLLAPAVAVDLSPLFNGGGGSPNPELTELPDFGSIQPIASGQPSGNTLSSIYIGGGGGGGASGTGRGGEGGGIGTGGAGGGDLIPLAGSPLGMNVNSWGAPGGPAPYGYGDGAQPNGSAVGGQGGVYTIVSGGAILGAGGGGGGNPAGNGGVRGDIQSFNYIAAANNGANGSGMHGGTGGQGVLALTSGSLSVADLIQIGGGGGGGGGQGGGKGGDGGSGGMGIQGASVSAGGKILVGGNGGGSGTSAGGTGGRGGQGLLSIATGGSVSAGQGFTIGGAIGTTSWDNKAGGSGGSGQILISEGGTLTSSGPITIRTGSSLVCDTWATPSPAPSVSADSINCEGEIVIRRDGVQPWTSPVSGAGRFVINKGIAALQGAGTLSGSLEVALAPGTKLDCSGTSAQEVRIGTLYHTGTDAEVALGSKTLRFNPSLYAIAADRAFPGRITGSGSVIVDTSYRIYLTGENTYAGGTVVENGILGLGKGGSGGMVGGSLQNKGAVWFDHSVDRTFTGPVSGTGTLEKRNSNALTLAGNHNYNGGVLITGGTLRITDGPATGNSRFGNVHLGMGTKLEIDTTKEVLIAGTISGDGVTGTIEGKGQITKTGSGKLIYSGVNQNLLPTRILAGTLQIGQGDNQYNRISGSPTEIASGASLRFNFNYSSITVQHVQLTGAGEVEVIGGSKILLSNPQDFEGSISAVDGIIQVWRNGAFGKASHLSGSAQGTFSLRAGTTADTSAGITLTSELSVPIQLQGSGYEGKGAIRSDTGANTISHPVHLSGTTRIHAEPDSQLSLTGGVSSPSSGALEKTGGGKLSITTAPAYSGDTEIREGTLALSLPGLSDNGTVSIDSTATLHLGFAGTDTVRELSIGGARMPPGVYGASHPGGRITGNGTLTVTAGATLTPYRTWEAAHGIAGAGASADSDGDGLPNGLEFVLGGDPSGPDSNSSTLVPVATKAGNDLVFRFRRSAASVSYPPRIEYSNHLSAWTLATNGIDGVRVEVENDFHGEGMHRVTLRVPVNPNTGKLFARLVSEIGE